MKIISVMARERSSLQDLKDKVKLLHDLFADKHNETVDVKISAVKSFTAVANIERKCQNKWIMDSIQQDLQ